MDNFWRSSDEEIQDFIDQEVLPLARGQVKIRMSEYNKVERIAALQKWHEKLSAFSDGVKKFVDEDTKEKAFKNWSDINWPKRIEGVLTEVEEAISTLSESEASIAKSLYPSLASGELE